jgi:hypothetical protein
VQRITDQKADRVRRWLFGRCESGNDVLAPVGAFGERVTVLSGKKHRTFKPGSPSLRDVGKRDVVTRGAKIEFVPDAVVIRTQPGFDLEVEILQVLERPAKLQFMVERHALTAIDGPGGCCADAYA